MYMINDRQQALGGSDIGAILGLSKYRSPVDVWLEKTGQLTTSRNTLPLRFGSYAEEFVAREYEQATGYRVAKYEPTLVHPSYAYCTGHVDRLVSTDQSPVINDQGAITTSRLLECKTAHPFTLSEWGSIGSDEIPMSYLVQCQWYLLLTGCQYADLAVLIGNTDLRVYTVTHDPQLADLLIERAVHFWEHHVLKKIPPSPQHEQDLRKLFPQSQAISKEAPSELATAITQLHSIHAHISEEELRCQAIKEAIMTYLEDADTLTYQGKVIATWKSPKPSTRLDSAKLSKEHPELAQAYQLPIQNSRRLTIKEIR